MLEISLQGQVGIVTGAGTPFGIGRSMVLAAARAGASVVYACDLSISAVPALVEEIQSAGLQCSVVGHFLDVSHQDQTIALLKDIIRSHGRLDFFFANAGYARYRSLDKLDMDAWSRAVQVMQTGPFLALKYGAQAMSVVSDQKPRPKGNIIITSSCAAFAGAYADAAYTAVKKACIGLVESGSVQLAASGIRVNGIAPGCTASSILTSSQEAETGNEYKTEATKEEVAATHAKFFERGGLFEEDQKHKFYNRVADPDEIANLACFLSSDLSLAINGQVILADSGKTLAATGEGFTGPVGAMPPLAL